jgi:hypothetical protein
LLAQPHPPLQAAEASPSSCPIPFDDPDGPDKPRLEHQQLTSTAARQQISNLLDQPPFENRENVTRWRLGDAGTDEVGDEDDSSLLQGLKNLLLLLGGLASVKWLAVLVEGLLWGSLFFLMGLLLWRYREWLRTFGQRLRLPQRAQPVAPEVLFGLQVTPESLPADIAGSAEQLWASQPRAALGLLYRGLLSHLLHDFQLPLKGSHTENEVLQLVRHLEQPALEQFSQQLTRDWQRVAYGHQLPTADAGPQLCEAWRELFPQAGGA